MATPAKRPFPDAGFTRDAVFQWLFLMVTFGLYGFFWIIRLARDVDGLAGRGPYLLRHARRSSFAFLGYFLLLAVIVPWSYESGAVNAPWFEKFVELPAFWLQWAVGVYHIWVQVRVAREVRALSGGKTPSARRIVVQALLCEWSLTTLQFHVNALLCARRDAGANLPKA